MKKSVQAWVPVMAACAALAPAFFVCSPNLDGGETGFSISLSVNTKGATEADFSGEALTAILSFSDTVDFSEIHWELGRGLYLYPAVRKGTELRVPIYWGKKGMPLALDSLTGTRYEYVYVTARGVQSNRIRVNVLNRAPMIDTLYVGDTAFFIGENIFSQNTYAYKVGTALQVYIAVDAYDLDDDVPFAVWRAAIDSLALKSYTNNSFKRVYQTPLTNFRDTVMVNVEDGHGGKAGIFLVLARTSGVIAVAFDSVRVGTTVLKGDSVRFNYTFVTFDTLPLQVFTGTQQPVLAWSARHGSIDSLAPFMYVYRCTLSTKLDTLTTDTSFALDTLKGIITNASFDTARIAIAVIKRPLNQRPVIDSVKVDGVRCDSVIRVQGGASLTFAVYAHDPDGGNVSIEWQSKVSGRIQSQSGTQATYVSLVEPYTDTITVAAIDNYLFTARDTFRIMVNLQPVIDSVFVNATKYEAPIASDIFFDATMNDTIYLSAYARDPEGKAITVTWAAKVVPMALAEVSQTTIRYRSLDVAYTDTLTCTVTDADKFIRQQKVILRINNRRPSIDSLVTPVKRFRFVDAVWDTSLTVRDRMPMTLYVSDADNNISSREWSLNTRALGTLTIIDPLRIETEYVAADSLYRDTVTIRVIDTKSAYAQRRLIINVNNRPPVVDSIKIQRQSTLLQAFVSPDSVYTYTSAFTPDTFSVSVKARDPDKGTLTYAWTKSGVLVSSNADYEYKGVTASYVDTLVITVRDDKQTTARKKVRLVFTQ